MGGARGMARALVRFEVRVAAQVAFGSYGQKKSDFVKAPSYEGFELP